jgi:hypothetical protein
MKRGQRVPKQRKEGGEPFEARYHQMKKQLEQAEKDRFAQVARLRRKISELERKLSRRRPSPITFKTVTKRLSLIARLKALWTGVVTIEAAPH